MYSTFNSYKEHNVWTSLLVAMAPLFFYQPLVMRASVIKGVSPAKESLTSTSSSEHVAFGLKRISNAVSAVLVGSSILTLLWNAIKVLFQLTSYQVRFKNSHSSAHFIKYVWHVTCADCGQLGIPQYITSGQQQWREVRTSKYGCPSMYSRSLEEEGKCFPPNTWLNFSHLSQLLGMAPFE